MANDDNNGGLFTSGVSPPLILALLAVFFFIAAIFTFAWRRRHLGAHGLLRDIGDLEGAPAFGPWVREGSDGTMSIDLDQKPRLWECWVGDGNMVQYSVSSWKDAKVRELFFVLRCHLLSHHHRPF